MRGSWRAGWVCVAAAVLICSPGAGAKVRLVKNVALTATGALTYSWSGDSARGCAAVGVCGIRGELILRPQPSGNGVSPGSGPVTIFLDTSSAARVVREAGGIQVGECVDLPTNSFAMLLFNPPTRRPTTATVQPPPSSGRCAGPTTRDLAGLSLPVRRSGRGLSFNLTGRRSFVAGPFSGTLVSTLRLASAPSSSSGFSSSSSGPGRPAQPTRAPAYELIQLQYRVSPSPGAIETHFSGTGDPSCQIVDACGTSGSLGFTLQPSRTLTVVGQRLVHRRLDRRQMLNDVRRGRVALTTFELLSGHVSETFSWPGGSTCHDVVPTPSLLLNTGSPQRPPTAARTVPVTVNANGGPPPNVYRTHCPGPDDAELLGAPLNGESVTYATGSITTDQLLSRRSVLTLSEPGSFTGLGYTGSRSGSIALDLTLIKASARVQP